MRRMVIAVPAWGRHYIKLFLGPTLRSHRAAISALDKEFRGAMTVRYVVQTDQPIEVARALRDFEVTIIPPPTELLRRNPMRSMSGTHQHAIDGAAEGERVILLNADMMISTEALVAAEYRFLSGKRAIVSASTRTVPRVFGPPEPLPARQLLEWTMRHVHQIPKSCFWGSGRCALPWGVYFRENNAIVLRAFHLHPFAIVKDRPIKFTGTIDMDLIDNYRHEEIHLVTDADEMALAEVSPKWRTHGNSPWPIDVGAVLAWAIRGARSMHWWNFRHRIAIVGNPDSVSVDGPVADEVMRLCPYPTVAEAPL
jgi:hypothetical protein